MGSWLILHCLCLRWEFSAFFFFNQWMLNTNLLRVQTGVSDWRNQKHQSHANRTSLLLVCLSRSPRAASLGVGAAAELGTGRSHPIGSRSETHPWRSWALDLVWNSTFVNVGAVEPAGFQLWLHWLSPLGPEESYISAQRYWPLFQLHCCSPGMFLTAPFLLWIFDHWGTPLPLTKLWAGYKCSVPRSAAVSLQFLPVTSV